MRSSSPAVGSSAPIVAEKSRRSKAAKACDTAGTQGPDGITTLARELVHLPCARLQRRVIASHDLREGDVHVGKGHASARKRAVREVVHHAPCFSVTRMPGEFPAPQKGNCIVYFPARRPAVYIGREGFPEKPERCRRIAGLEIAESEMPTQVAI